jgi:DNA repair protein RecN (Recombination protein N)
VLIELELQHLATFESARLEFDPGLNIVSGMSGAGKSVLLKALELVLGGRFSQRMLRDGASQAEVRALWQVPPALLEPFREELGESVTELYLRRVFRREGRTSNYINDKMVSADLLKRLGFTLARVLNQDESLGLRDPERQLELLDQVAGLGDELTRFREVYQSWTELRSEVEALKASIRDAADQDAFRRFQLEELQKLQLQGGETEALEEELRWLSAGGDVEAQGQALLELAEGFALQGDAPLLELKGLVGKLEGWKPLLEEGLELRASCEAWLSALRDSLSAVEHDPQRLNQVEFRLSQLKGAQKRFGRDENELILWMDELEVQLDGPPPQLALERAEQRQLELLEQGQALAAELHERRSSAAQSLSAEINLTLEQLEMTGERFSIECESSPWSATGTTALTFMLKPMAEARAQPLHETASGGERSRALLAISSALRGALKVPLLVFDEIDTNMGARLAKPVSESFRKLAQSSQVICVTHLAPVAASGQRHFLIEKGAQQSSLRALEKGDRLAELAHMTAGDRSSPEAIEQAQVLLTKFGSVS